jgi:hypothetical protein
MNQNSPSSVKPFLHGGFIDQRSLRDCGIQDMRSGIASHPIGDGPKRQRLLAIPDPRTPTEYLPAELLGP